MAKDRVLIVGGGVAGLSCALSLQEARIPFQILEASDDVGGRLRTDEFEGFLLDRGFHVYLTASPEGRRALDYGALELREFQQDVMVRKPGRFERISDPWRRRGLVAGWRSPVGRLRDGVRLRGLRREVQGKSLDALLDGENHTTMALLRNHGLSMGLINSLFRPFIGGFLLDTGLQPSSKMFEVIFKMVLEGAMTVPAKGIGQISRQLATRLPKDGIRLNARVKAVTRNSVTLETGEVISGEAVVLACDGITASQLTAEISVQRWRGTRCIYFEAPESPIDGPLLLLNANGQWPINMITVMSEVSRDYAPPGRSLVSITVLGKPTQTENELQLAVRAQLDRWFGRQSRSWRHLRTYTIPSAQPDVSPTLLSERPVRLPSGVYVAGEHRTIPTLDFAMLSGRMAGEAVIQDLAARPTSAKYAAV